MSYRIKAFQHEDKKWEAKYQEENKLTGKDFVEIGQSFRLGKFFNTEEEANKYAIGFLKQRQGISEQNIQIIKN